MINKVFSILGIVILFLIFSCSSSGRFGISQRYYLDKSEQERPLDKFIVEKYEGIINIDTLNVPLNKFIVTKHYKVYIGVSFNANANTLYSIYKNDTSFKFYQDVILLDTVSVFFKKHGDYYYSILYNSPKDKFTYILTLTSDSITVNEKYKSSFLINKISNAN